MDKMRHTKTYDDADPYWNQRVIYEEGQFQADLYLRNSFQTHSDDPEEIKQHALRQRAELDQLDRKDEGNQQAIEFLQGYLDWLDGVQQTPLKTDSQAVNGAAHITGHLPLRYYTRRRARSARVTRAPRHVLSSRRRV